jgi:serine/threonine-protein kinase RsbW
MLCVPATPHSLCVVRRYVTGVAAQAGLGRCAAYRLQLAVDEIVTNIVTHGHANRGATATVAVWTWTARCVLHVVVEDTGPAYAPDFGAPRVLDHTSVEHGSGGLGLFLAERSVDLIRYERRHGRNWHRFEMARATTDGLPLEKTQLLQMQS